MRAINDIWNNREVSGKMSLFRKLIILYFIKLYVHKIEVYLYQICTKLYFKSLLFEERF